MCGFIQSFGLASFKVCTSAYQLPRSVPNNVVPFIDLVVRILQGTISYFDSLAGEFKFVIGTLKSENFPFTLTSR